VTSPTYEVSISGPLPPAVLGDLGSVDTRSEVRTVLSGRFPDQAALYGFLHRLRDFGLEVVEVRRLEQPDEPEDGHP
jgi:hypothetical protein